MNAVFREYHDWESAPAYKLLTDNRDLYLLQSQRTRNGAVAEFPKSPSSQLPNPSPAGRALSNFKDSQ